MHLVARARLVLARRPWIRWSIVAVSAVAAAAGVDAQVAQVAAERDRWGATRAVLVASQPLEPGDALAGELVELPIAALPDGALAERPADARARQRVPAGAVVTEHDVAPGPGPAALAEPGTVVVALSDPLARGVAVGLEVQVAADGLVVAHTATVTEVVDDVIFVAVEQRSAASVAAAAQEGIASLLYVP